MAKKKGYNKNQIVLLGAVIISLVIVMNFNSQESKLDKSYELSQEMPGLLKEITCHCGCASEEHPDLSSCFSYCYDNEHDCGTCQDEVILVSELNNQGLSIEEIKEEINSKFGK